MWFVLQDLMSWGFGSKAEWWGPVGGHQGQNILEGVEAVLV